MSLTKEQVKTIAPVLENNKAWHDYVDWFWNHPDRRDNADSLAYGFQAGYSAAKRENNTMTAYPRENNDHSS